MKPFRLSFIGFGNVGQALARLLLAKQNDLLTQHHISFCVTGIATNRHGKAINPDGIDLNKALALMENHQSLAGLASVATPDNFIDFIKACPADVLFENSPVNHQTGQPAVSHIRAGLENNQHCITANKGTVVHGYRQLTDLALRKGKRFLFESTVMDGAPIFSLFRASLPSANIQQFEGILNSTTNMILEKMEQGLSFEEAVDYTQSIGLAETDPTADVDGWDAAIKVAALVTVLLSQPMLPQDVRREGISGISPEMITRAVADGKRWKLVCRAFKENDRWCGTVKPELVSSSSVLYNINGSSSYCEFKTDTLPGLGVVEGNPGPQTTAYGLLSDFINLTRGI